LLVGMVSSPPALAVPITVQPAATVIGPGQTFSVDIVIGGVIDLFAFQFDLTFDPTIIAASSVTEGPFLPTGGPTSFFEGFIDNANGEITFTADTLLGAIPGVTGSGTLVTATFAALAPGISGITPSNVILLDSSLVTVPASVEDATVSVVPAPATVLLLASGALAWGVFWRRKRP
jgi:Cohesin domain/PEP-CTERM motif